MISGVPLFRGRDNQDQLLHIMRIIGTPTAAQFAKLSKDTVREIRHIYESLTDLPLARNHYQAIPYIPQNALPQRTSQGFTTRLVDACLSIESY
jgi:hypothetical protein